MTHCLMLTRLYAVFACAVVSVCAQAATPPSNGLQVLTDSSVGSVSQGPMFDGTALSYYQPIRKQGPGVWVLSAPNTVWGPVQLLEGGLSIQHSQAVGPDSHLDVMAGTWLDYAPGLVADFPVQGHAQPGAAAIAWHVHGGQAQQTGPVFGAAVWNKTGDGVLWLDQRRGGSLDGTFSVQQGGLGVRGSVPAQVQVTQGAWLWTQDAVVGNVSVSSGGRVRLDSPGRPLHILSDLYLAPGAIVNVNVHADGRADQLYAQGRAQLAGALWVDLERPDLSGDYRIVQADGGSAGHFESLRFNQTSFVSGLEYDPQGVTLVLRQAPSVPPENPLAAVVERPQIWLRHLLNAWRAQLMQDAWRITQAWRRPGRPANGSWGHYDHAGQQGLAVAGMALDRQLDTLAVGVDAAWHAGRVGVLAGFQTSRLRDQREPVRSDAHSYYGGLYGSQSWRGLDLSLTLVGGLHHTRHDWQYRQGRGRAFSAQLLVDVAYPFWVQAGHTVGMQAQWRAMHLRQAGMDMNGVDQWQVASQTTLSQDSRLWLSWSYEPPDTVAAHWQARLGWERQWRGPGPTHHWMVDGLPAGDAAAFRSNRNARLLELRMQAPLWQGSMLAVTYRARRSARVQDHGFSLQAQWLF